MTIAASDLGDLEQLGKALGVFTADGEPDPGWFGNPAARLGSMLANDDQRSALLAFVDRAFDDGDVESDASGGSFVRIIHATDPDISIGVIMRAGAEAVDIGVCAELATEADPPNQRPASHTRLEVPLFRTRRGTAPAPPNPILLGQPGGRIRLSSRIDLAPGAPAPGQFHLGSIGVSVDVPTATSGDGPPVIGLSLGQLQLPGGSPRDFDLRANGTDDLDDVVLELVLGLVQAQNGGGGVLDAVAGLIGLRPGLPPLPIDDVLANGVRAVTSWLQTVLGSPVSRATWLGHLVGLVGGAVNAAGDGVTFTFGIAELTVGVRTSTNGSGQLTLIPFVTTSVGAPDRNVVADVDLLACNLSTGATMALPRLAVFAFAGRPAGGAQPVLLDIPAAAPAPAVIVEAVRVGIALDPQRLPVFVLAADRVKIGTHPYDTLDLTSTDALMDVAGAVVDSVVGDLLDRLGPFAQAAQVLFGLAPPAGAPGVPTISLPELASDPLGAVHRYWSTLLTSHADAVPAVLDVLRQALASTSAGVVIRGSGTAGQPWLVPLGLGVDLRVHVAASVVHIAIGATTRVDTLGERCTVIEGDLALELATIDLAQRSGSIATRLSAELRLRARGVAPTRAELDLEFGTVAADHIAITIEWSPATGLACRFDAPHASLTMPDVGTIALPALGTLDPTALNGAEWDAVQRLLGTVAPAASGWIADLARILGWSGEGPSLRLADIVGPGADPTAAVRAWLAEALIQGGGDVLRLLADALLGDGNLTAAFGGRGNPASPFALGLGDNGPDLLVWLTPEGPDPVVTAVADQVRIWRPGDAGLESADLATAIAQEAAIDTGLADLVWNRDVQAGIDGLVARWSGSDGIVVPPAVAPPGVELIALSDLAAEQLRDAIDVEALIGRAPIVTIHVAVGAAAADVWPDVDPARRISLVEPNRQPETFAPAVAGGGDWFLALGTRDACRLATGDPDGTLGQAGRLGRVLAALAPLGQGQVLVGHAESGQACRLAAAAAVTVSDLITTATPLGPISLTVLDERHAGDVWHLLDSLIPSGADDIDDVDLARGRALLHGFRRVDALADPGRELREPAGGAPTRAGLAHRAVFGVIDAEAVRRSITAIVAAGLAARAAGRAEVTGDEAHLPTGIRAGIRMPIRTDAGTLLADGYASVDVGGWDVGENGISRATDRAVRVRCRIGARNGWLAGGPDPARGPSRPREHALRALAVEIDLPRGVGSTADARTRITLLDGCAFGVARERWELAPGGEPVGAEARLLLSLAIGRIVTDATASTPSATAIHLRSLLDALGLVAADGSVADAVESLVHQPATLVAEALAAAPRRDAIAAAIRALVGGAPIDVAAPAVVRVAGGAATTTIDLAGRTVTLEAPSGSGRFGWAAHMAFDNSAINPRDDWWVRIGRDGEANPAGAAWFEIDAAGARLRWRLAGQATPTTLPLWPTLDVGRAGAAVTQLLPALVGQAALELLREFDDLARPVVDAALDAFGLLDRTMADLPKVRLPLGLVADPVGWLMHSAVLGGRSSSAIALFEAVKPLLGVSGSSGVLDLAPGVRLAVSDAAGAIRVAASVDTAAFGTALASPVGRLVGGLSTTITIGNGAPQLGLDVFVGLGGSTDQRRAVHVVLDGGIRVVLRPANGADIPLYPAGPGLAAAAVDQVVGQALPFVLDTLAAQNGNNLVGDIGKLVAAVGDALGLRDASPSFVYDRLKAWALDPASGLEAASTTILSGAVASLAPLLDDVLPVNVSVTAPGGSLRVAAGSVAVTWRPSPFRIELEASATTLPGIGQASATIALTSEGIDAVETTIGPVPVPVGQVTLRPVLKIAAGARPAGGRQVALGLDLDGSRQLVARWLLDAGSVGLAVLDGTDVDTTAVGVSAALVEAVASLAASIALATPEVGALLATPIPGGANATVATLLDGVVLAGNSFDTGLFNLQTLTRRVVRLIDNLASAGLDVKIEVANVGALTIGIAHDATGTAGVTLGLDGRLRLGSGSDITIALEVDDDWIDPRPTLPGITVGIVKLSGNTVTFAPSLTVAGVGLRIAKSNGPLLDLGITVESIAIHTFAGVSASGVSGGVQLQFTNLAVSPAGASGGNSIASGILSDTGGQRPKPAFSPALAIQKHGTGDVSVALRAGVGDGPWWIAIQKGFGPLYIEQVGLRVEMPSRAVESIGILLDAKVSLFGLTCAVDDLSVTYIVSKGNFFEPSNWEVDLRGLAVAAEIGPLSIAGGLLKSGSGEDIEYLGMLLGRFGIYGITIYGGYGKHHDVVSFFAVGAVVGPIGGPPAFFVTGIGGGFGINRRLVIPTDLSQFGTYPLIQALDPAASPPSDPMAQLHLLGEYFPPQAGTFWFAGGISFTSFALVDGVAVLAMQFGDGFEISLLGLARMALPRPQVAIVSIELALVARISSKEGVVWVQGQLTDNSWLLYPDVRLTGGFAFVVWFAGPHRGEFVLTIGGFHPDFKRDGYPVVPRLGLQWKFGPVTVKGGSYFALTSEAVMAGVELQASASFGWAWAKATFGAHGIVYFDPFHYQVDAYARVSAGVTIDTWFGDISFSVSVGARIAVEGPDFRARVTVEVGPCDVTLKFGSTTNNATPKLQAGEFVPKYLEEASSGVARVITSIVTAGGLGPGPAADGREQNPPDGTSERPFIVTAEFVMTVTTLVPAQFLAAGGNPVEHPPTHALGIAPMGIAEIRPVLTLAWQRDGGAPQPWPFQVATRPFGSFPVGVWGKPQDPDSPTVPKGEVIDALNEVQLTAVASLSPAGPEIDARRLDPPDKRRPLPFLRHADAERTKIVDGARRLEQLVNAAELANNAPVLAAAWKQRAGASPVELAAFAGRRLVAARVGSLGDGLARDDRTVLPTVAKEVEAIEVDRTVYAPHAVAILGSGSSLPDGAWPGTTVSNRPRVARVAPPTLSSLKGTPAAARLVLADTTSQRDARTVIATGTPASTRATRSAPATVAKRGSDGVDRLGSFSRLLARRTGTVGLRAGESVVFALPNSRRDTDAARRPSLTIAGCPTRFVVLAQGGDVLSDQVVYDVRVDVPIGAERLVVAALGEGSLASNVAGWHAGMPLTYLGWSTALCPGAVLHVSGSSLPRGKARAHAGFAEAAEMVAGRTTVTTRFSAPVNVVMIVVDDPSPDAADPIERRLLIGLDGATQATDASGRPTPPVVLAAGNRSILAYRVEPVTDAAGAVLPVSVTVASGSEWSVVGVLGTRGDPGTAATGVAGKGFDAMLGTSSPPGRGEVRLSWQPVPDTKSAAPRRSASPKQATRSRSNATTTPARRRPKSPASPRKRGGRHGR